MLIPKSRHTKRLPKKHFRNNGSRIPDGTQLVEVSNVTSRLTQSKNKGAIFRNTVITAKNYGKVSIKIAGSIDEFFGEIRGITDSGNIIRRNLIDLPEEDIMVGIRVEDVSKKSSKVKNEGYLSSRVVAVEFSDDSSNNIGAMSSKVGVLSKVIPVWLITPIESMAGTAVIASAARITLDRITIRDLKKDMSHQQPADNMNSSFKFSPVPVRAATFTQVKRIREKGVEKMRKAGK